MLSITRMTRSRLYVLFDAFENDTRGLIREYILPGRSEEEVLEHCFERSIKRRESDNAEDLVDLIEYLDLREAYDLLNRYRSDLPKDLSQEIRRNTGQMDALVPIRNRVMHGRPLHAGDPDSAVSSCYAFDLSAWPTLRATLDHLVADPLWEPAFETTGRRSDRILNNLPEPDYDDTGLVGRSAERKELVTLLKRRRHSVVTIIGEGGIGKTALALEVAYAILDDPESKYDCILWASLKVDRLTTGGISEIVDAVKDITGATEQYGRALDEEFSGGSEKLGEMLEGIETLLVLDNLETVDGREVLAFMDSLPVNVTFLFTSRVGIGEVERRKELGPLSDADADRLFRMFARSRDIGRLAQLGAGTVREVSDRLRNSPLAIRWYVLSVEAGQQPNLAIHNQEVLLNFCVRSVHRAMTERARMLLSVVFALDRPTSFDELIIYTSYELDDVRKSVHELLRGSLVTLTTDIDDELVTRVALTQACRQFLGRVEPPCSDVIENVHGKEQEFRKAEELRRLEERNRQLAPNVVRLRTPNDAPTAHVLRTALEASKQGDADRAYTYVNKAREMNPEFWEVDRVQGFIYSRFDLIEPATAAYRAALRSAGSDDLAKGVIGYYFSSHLARKARDLPAALVQARVANDHFGSEETAKHLGTLLIWDRQFEEGQQYLEQALESARGKLRLIVLTSLADSWRRWAENSLDEDRRPSEAISKAYAGFSIAHREIVNGTHDLRLGAVAVESAKAFLRAVTNPGVEASEHVREIVSVLEGIKAREGLFRRTRAWEHFPAHVSRLTRYDWVSKDLREVALSFMEQSTRPQERRTIEEGEKLEGEICAWLDTYGFIAHPAFPENVFFPASAVAGLTASRAARDLNGFRVSFTVHQDDMGRNRATEVRLIAVGDLTVDQ